MDKLIIRVNGQIVYKNQEFFIEGKSKDYIELCRRVYDLAFITKNIFGEEIKKINLNFDGS